MLRQIARQVAGRCHVGWSRRRVLREARGSLKKSAPKDLRHAFYREVLKAHDRNRGLYARCRF